jgi:Rrf2 family protein
MHISKGCDYALRAILYLSSKPKEKIFRLEEISISQDIPKKFLAKILPVLVKNGIVKSHQGFQGGYLLGKSPSDITFLDIVEAIEGPIVISKCLEDESSCERRSSCNMHSIWSEVNDVLRNFLGRKKIVDILTKKGDDSYEMPKM